MNMPAVLANKEPRFPTGILQPERPIDAIPRRRFNGRLGLNGKKAIAYVGCAILLLVAALAGVFSVRYLLLVLTSADEQSQYKNERDGSVHNAYDGNAQQQGKLTTHPRMIKLTPYQTVSFSSARFRRCECLCVFHCTI